MKLSKSESLVLSIIPTNGDWIDRDELENHPNFTYKMGSLGITKLARKKWIEFRFIDGKQEVRRIKYLYDKRN